MPGSEQFVRDSIDGITRLRAAVGVTAENVAEPFGVSREDQDEFTDPRHIPKIEDRYLQSPEPHVP